MQHQFTTLPFMNTAACATPSTRSDMPQIFTCSIIVIFTTISDRARDLLLTVRLAFLVRAGGLVSGQQLAHLWRLQQMAQHPYCNLVCCIIFLIQRTLIAIFTAPTRIYTTMLVPAAGTTPTCLLAPAPRRLCSTLQRSRARSSVCGASWLRRCSLAQICST